MNAIFKIYDFFVAHKSFLVLACAIMMTVLTVLACSLSFDENIFDFLPQDEEYTESMQVYASLNEAQRIVIIFEGDNTDSIAGAIESFAEKCPDAITEVDFEGFANRLQYMCDYMPYFLTDESYRKLETICDQSSDTMSKILLKDMRMLSMPGSSFLGTNIASDPFNLIPIAQGAVGQYAGVQSAFTSYNGYIMNENRNRGFAFFDSKFGSIETGHNSLIVDTLSAQIYEIKQLFPTLNIRLLGAPVIAVENSRQIKKDSAYSITISVILIFLLLFYAFPRTLDVLYIFVTVAFGWLTGMAALYLFVGSVSVIVLGIGAVIIGISINYPLHILVHQRYTITIKQTLKEVLPPLVVGNVTTVGAFFALIPLGSPALRQLGLFASTMLMGTLFFSVFVLPHIMSSKPAGIREIHLPITLQCCTNKWHFQNFRRCLSIISLVGFVLMTIYIVVVDYSVFDPNLSHINYMTEQQKRDFAWLESLSPVAERPAFLANSAREELMQRENKWNQFWLMHSADSLAIRLQSEARRIGFREDAFEPFVQKISQPAPKLDLRDPNILASVWPGRFDDNKMNSSVTESLIHNFDYIGFVCSAIVLIFLCISFHDFWIGLIAFLPMLLSWVLIIAFMQLFELQFNIVNVILATFIFGQGDDYTIFVVEGLLYERRYGKKIVNRYKQSILLSAIVMLLSIGVLVFAKHPAMRSLGAVTLIGMGSVVLMAFAVPPVLLKIYTYFRPIDR